MGKNIGCRKLLLQTLCCLVGIRAKRRDVDKRCNSRVDTGRGDDGTTIGVTDQDRGPGSSSRSRRRRRVNQVRVGKRLLQILPSGELGSVC